MDTAGTPWHAAYPPPRNPNAAGVAPHQLLNALRGGDSSGLKDFALIDLRRNDHEVIYLLEHAFLLPLLNWLREPTNEKRRKEKGRDLASVLLTM